MNASLNLRQLARYPLIPVIVLMAIGFELATGSFVGSQNLLGIATDSATLAIVAVPSALLVISGYLDLSVGFMRGQVKVAGDPGALLHVLPLISGRRPVVALGELLPA